MSLCDPIMEDKVSCHENFVMIKHSRDIIKLLQVIKQIMYSNRSKNTHSTQPSNDHNQPV